MKRWERISAILGLLVVVLAVSISSLQNRHVFRLRETTVKTPSCNVPTTQLEHTSAPAPGSAAVIIHGLSANRTLMEPVARWMAIAQLRPYLIDMPGHGDNDEPFSFARAEQCAAEFLAELTRRGELDPARTILVGHSTGAGIAIRLADRFNAAATIAISPAPLTPQPGPWERVTPFALPSRLPQNLLVFIASLDPFPIRDSAKQWVAVAGGNNDSEAAFREGRALRLVDVARATHTSLLVDSVVGRKSVSWARRALGMPGSVAALSTPPFAYAIALLGALLTFPAGARLILKRTASARVADPAPAKGIARWKLYATWATAATFAVVVLRFWIPLRPLRLFSGDYLASLLLIVGAIAMATYGNRSLHTPFGPTLRAALLGLAIMLAISWLLAWQATDVWMNAARWARFPFVLLAVLPYALAEEWALEAPQEGARAAALRVLRALTLRGILWTAMLAAFLLLGSNQVLMPLLALYMLFVSLGQRMGADIIRRRGGTPAAAAIFNAILGAWFIAAVFPLT